MKAEDTSDCRVIIKHKTTGKVTETTLKKVNKRTHTLMAWYSTIVRGFIPIMSTDDSSKKLDEKTKVVQEHVAAATPPVAEEKPPEVPPKKVRAKKTAEIINMEEAKKTVKRTKKPKARARKKKKKTDKINHPSHYSQFKQHEPIAVIEEWQTGYALGNCLKYIARTCGAKPKYDHLQGRIEDLKKARFYLNKRITELETQLLGK
jgi:hypothetical protein